MLYMMSLSHTPDVCPGVSIEIRDRVVRMNATMTQVLQSHGCTFQGGWISKGAHLTFILVDAPTPTRLTMRPSTWAWRFGTHRPFTRL